MRSFAAALLLLFSTGAFVFGQTDDYNKTEVFVGYLNNQVDTGIDGSDISGININKREPFHGFNASGVYNFSRYIGVKADVSGTYNNKSFNYSVNTPTPSTYSFKTKNSLYNVLGGVQIKDNSTEKRIKPFAHALVGIGITRTDFEDVSCTPNPSSCVFTVDTFVSNSTGLAGAFGGGLDIKVNNRIDVRAFQVDYNPVRAHGTTLNNLRFGVGIIIK